jgi:hypothetical protein
MFLKPSRKSIEADCKLLLLGYLVGLLFNPEAGGNMFFLNIMFCKLHGVTLQKTILFSAVLTVFLLLTTLQLTAVMGQFLG